jgi:hypothetical protein
MASNRALISKSEFARRHRLSHQRVSQYVAAGLPLRDGKVPAERGAKWLAANTDAARKNHWGDGDASLNELRRQREQQKIEAARLELQKARDEVIEKTTVRRFIAGRAALERDAWLSWTSAVSARLAAALGADTGKVFGLIEAEVRDQLRHLAERALKDGNGTDRLA